HGGDEVDRDGHVDVGTALARLAGERAAYVAEQLAENVAGIEAAPRTARLRPRSRAALGVGTPKAGLRSFGARCVDLSPIEAGPLGSVREEVIGSGGLPEPLLDLVVSGVEVRVQLLRELAVCSLDILRAGIPGNAEHGVRVAHFRGIGSAHDPPGTVRLAAGGPVCLFHLASDIDGLLELPAIGTVLTLICPRRRHRAVVAAVRVSPFRLAAGRVGRSEEHTSEL